MDNVRQQVLGYRNFNRKSDGKPLTVITVIMPCTPRDNDKGSFGNRCSDIFLPDNLVGTLKPDCIGQELVLTYELGGFGRPVVSNVAFKPWK